jgi:glycosyltransferase involved in cell wall biosynthesis
MEARTVGRSDLFVSVVAPVRNAENYVEAYVREISGLVSAHFKDFEIVLVDDHSRDGTAERIRRLQAAIPNVQLYRLARHVGQETAYVVGLERAIGDIVVTMDARFDPAGPVMELIAEYYRGYEIIYGLRQDRAGHGAHHPYQLLSRGFYRLYHAITGEDIPAEISSLRLLSRRVVNTFLENRDRYNLFMVIASFVGIPYATLRYERINRSGEPARSDYVDAVGRAISLLLLSSKRPLRFMTFGSVIGAIVSLIYGAYVLAVHFVIGKNAEGWASLSLQISGLFFLQFLILAIMSEYLIRIFVHSQNRLPYLIMEESSSMVLSRKVELNVVQQSNPRDASAS